MKVNSQDILFFLYPLVLGFLGAGQSCHDESRSGKNQEQVDKIGHFSLDDRNKVSTSENKVLEPLLLLF